MNTASRSDAQSPPPTISIGLPVYNGENYLCEALESLLKQTYKDFELIISNNASSDETELIIKKRQESDQRIRYFRQDENIGPGENYLFVLKQARGRFFMWAAHDDIWAENWLEALLANIRPTDIGVRGTIRFHENGSVIAERTPPDYPQGSFVRCFLANESTYRIHYAYSLFNREKLLAADLDSFKVDYFPDAILIYALIHHGDLRTITGTHMMYRLHNNNLGATYSAPWKGWKKIIFRIHPFRYYIHYLTYSKKTTTRGVIALLVPIKHVYAQVSFWKRAILEIITGKRHI